MFNDLSIYTSWIRPWRLSVAALVWYVLLSAGLWKVFEKAGEEGWKALIPFYNLYILFKISHIAPLFLVQMLCIALGAAASWLAGRIFVFYPLSWALSLGAAAIGIFLWYSLSAAFGHGLGYALGLCLMNPVFIMILGYGSSRYRMGWQ